MRSFLIKSNNYRPGNLGIYNYQVNIDENSGSVTLLTNVGEYILGGNGDIKLTNYYTKEEIDNIIQDLESGEIDLTRYYTKEQIDDLLDNIETGNVDLTNYFTKTEVEEYVNTQTDGYVDMATLDIITDNKISNATLDLVEKEPFNNLTSKVNTLEDRVNNIDTGDIDLSEYAKMEDIEGFITEADVDSKINNIVVDLTPIEESLDNKVDKVENKGLSTDDFIASEYYNRGEIDTKLEGYPTTSVVEGMIDDITAGDIDLAGYYSKVEVDTKLLTKVDSVEGKDLSSNDFTDSYKESLDGLSDALNTKADKAEVTTEINNAISGLNIDDYVKIDSLDVKLDTTVFETYETNIATSLSDLDGRINNLSNVQITTVDVLPEIGETNIIYLVPKGGESPTNNIKDEYIWILEGESGRFELIGTTEIDLSNYYTKDETFTKDETSALIDSVISGEIDLTNYYTKSETDDEITTAITVLDLDNKLSSKAEAEHTHTISEIDSLQDTLDSKLELDDLGGYPTITQMNSAIEGLNISQYETIENVDSKLDNKAESVHTHTIGDIDELQVTLASKLDSDALEDYSTTEQMNNAITSAIGDITNVTLELVDELPGTGVANIIYLVPNNGLGDNIKDEFIWINNAWEAIGTTEVDLSNYYNKSEVDGALSGKVDKDGNKVLSTNDYTTAEKDKLGNLDGTKDADKPISTATQAALDSKADSEHTHAISEIEGIQDALNLKANQATTYTKGEVDGLFANNSGGSLVKVDLEDGTVAYKLDSNGLIPTASSIDLRTGNQTTNLGQYSVCVSAELPEGLKSTASGAASTVSGGASNTASGEMSTVPGGFMNTASGETSTVSGGQSNTASGVASTISGGQHNTASGVASTVSGGLHNTATNYSETVVGMYSDNTGTPETSRVEGSPIFRVGIGTVNNRRDGFQVKNDGKVYAPHQTIALTTDPTQLVTKEYVDSIGGGTTYQMITAGGSHTFGSEYENYIILTNSTNDITITIPSDNTNYIVRNINPTGRVFFTAGTGATIHASSIGLVDDQYVISGYGMMSVIVYGTDIILTGGI